MGGSIPNNCASVPLLQISPLFPLGGRVSSCGFTHVTQYNSCTSRPTMLGHQEKEVFFPLHGREGKLRSKAGWLCPVPLSKAEFNGRELKSQEA